MYREITAVEHDRFVSESNQTNLLQSSNWPKVKDNWGSQLLGFFDGETQIASASPCYIFRVDQSWITPI